MSRAVLLDTNLLIGAFEPEEGNEQHALAKKRLRALLLDPEVKLAITPLIRYEVLRGARRVSIAKLDEKLDDFQEFDVRGADARRAAEIFRMAQQQGIKLDNHKFDVFHCVCAQLNQLEIESADSDILRIQKLLKSEDNNA